MLSGDPPSSRNRGNFKEENVASRFASVCACRLLNESESLPHPTSTEFYSCVSITCLYRYLADCPPFQCDRHSIFRRVYKGKYFVFVLVTRQQTDYFPNAFRVFAREPVELIRRVWLSTNGKIRYKRHFQGRN